jgi:hypothetical protein
VLSTPPAFVLSQDQTLRRKHAGDTANTTSDITHFDRDALPLTALVADRRRATGTIVRSDAEASNVGFDGALLTCNRVDGSKPVEAIARTRSLVLSSVFKERLLRALALSRALVPLGLLFARSNQPCGARGQSNDRPLRRQLQMPVSGEFLAAAR